MKIQSSTGTNQNIMTENQTISRWSIWVPFMGKPVRLQETSLHELPHELQHQISFCVFQTHMSEAHKPFANNPCDANGVLEIS